MYQTVRLSYRLAFLFALVAVPLAVEPEIHEQTELPKRMAAGLVAWALTAVWFLGSAWKRHDAAAEESEVSPLRSPTLILLLAFAVWSAATSVFAAHPARAVEPALLLIDSCLWFSIAWCAAGARWCRIGVLVALTVSAALAAVVGLFQYAAVHPGAFPFGFDALARLVPSVVAGEPWRGFPLVEQTDVPGSVFGHANVAAEFVAMAIPLAVLAGLAVLTSRRGLSRALAAIFAAALFVTAAILALFVVRAGSRAAILAVIAAAAIVWLHHVAATLVRRPLFGSRPAHGLVHALAVVLLVSCGVVALDSLAVSPRHGQHATTALRRLQSSLSTSNTTVRERLDLWANTVDMVEDHPAAGVGLGGFAIAYPRYAASSRQHESGRLSIRRQPERPHNEVIHVAAETGLPGAGLWIAAVLTVLVGGVIGLARSRLAPADRLVVLGCLAALAALLAVSMVAFPFRQTGTRLGFWVLAGVMARTLTRAPASGARPSLVRTGVLTAVCAIAFAVTLSHYRARWEAARSVRSYSQLVAMEGVLEGMGPRILMEQLRTLDRAAARVPHDYHVELLRGQVLRRLGRSDEAAASYRRCLALHPDLINAHVGLAQSLIAVGDVDGAETAARAAVDLNPRESRARMILGRVSHRRGLVDRALRDYRQALELQPSTPDRLQIHLDIAALHFDRDPLVAARNLQVAAALAPGDVRVLEAQARFMEQQSPGSQQAFDAWTALMRVAPGHVDAKIHVARSFLRARQFEAALALFDEAWESRPDPSILYERAQVLSGLGRLLEARDSLLECMNRCARNGDMALWTRCRELILPIEEGLAARQQDEGGTDG